MKHVMACAVAMMMLTGLALTVVAQDTAKPGLALGSVTLTKKVMADGQPLAAGTYQLRLSNDPLKPVVGQSPDGERYVEFLKGGKVVGREVATVISNEELATMAQWPKPAANSAKVETLKGAEYLRVWINHSGNNYLIHLPPS